MKKEMHIFDILLEGGEAAGGLLTSYIRKLQSKIFKLLLNQLSIEVLSHNNYNFLVNELLIGPRPICRLAQTRHKGLGQCFDMWTLVGL